MAKFTLTTGAIGSGTVSIEQKSDDSKQGFLVFRNGIGKTLFTGVVLKMHTAKVKEGKPTQCLAQAVCSTQDGDKFKTTPVQLSFNTADVWSKFIETFKSLTDKLA